MEFQEKMFLKFTDLYTWKLWSHNGRINRFLSWFFKSFCYLWFVLDIRFFNFFIQQGGTRVRDEVIQGLIILSIEPIFIRYFFITFSVNSVNLECIKQGYECFLVSKYLSTQEWGVRGPALPWRNSVLYGFHLRQTEFRVRFFLLWSPLGDKYVPVTVNRVTNVFSNLALTGIRIDNFMVIMCSINAWGCDILIFATIFPKSNIGWPQQPPTERVSDTSKRMDFWWSFPQKGTSVGHFGTRYDPTIRFRKFFGEMRLLRSLRPPRLLRLLRSLRLQRF